MIRAAIIGYGAIAHYHLLDIDFFSENFPLRAADDPVVKLVAGCDIRYEARERLAAETGIKAYADYREMLEQEHPDYIYIGACADTHLEPTLAAAELGIHVLCEKPMATEAAECDRMIEACDNAGVQLVISHQRRSDPVHWLARKLFDEGIIGELRYITGGAKSRRGGKEMHNIGSHLLDAIGIFSGSPTWVSGFCQNDWKPSLLLDREPGDRNCGWVLGDRIDVNVGYQTGTQAKLQFSEDPSELHWILWGTKGRLGMFNAQIWHCNRPVPAPNERWEPIEFRAEPVVTNTGYINPPDWVLIRQALDIHPRVFMMREMFQRMQTGGEHTSSGRVGAIPIEIMQATFASHLSGKRVNLPLENRESVLKPYGLN